MSSNRIHDLESTAATTQLTGPVLETAPYLPGSLAVDTEYRLDPADPIFTGHYPGFPIYPGVCLIECAHQPRPAPPEPDLHKQVASEVQEAAQKPQAVPYRRGP